MRILRIAALCLLACCIGTFLPAQSSVSTRGTDFWMAFMKNNEANSSESLSLYISSSDFSSGVVEIPGQSWSQSFVVTPGVTTSVDIPNNIAEMLSSGVVEEKGIHITTDQPVSVYALSFETNTSDATKILPIEVLGTEYMISAYSGTTDHESECVIVASADNTTIEITPSVNTVSGNSAGSTFTVDLQMGQSYQLKAMSNGDLTGTIIRSGSNSGSCRPFAVFSGAGCSTVPSDCFACDHLFEQNFPVKHWGKEYFVAPWVFELSTEWPVTEPKYTYRILASENGTVVNIDGVSAVNLNAGQFVEFNHETTAHCVVANKPVSVIEFMEGIACGGNGDPSMVILDDKENTMDEITFSTAESAVITSHYLNIILHSTEISQLTLDGSAISNAEFHSFPSCTEFVWCALEITAGSHTIVGGPAGFNAYVYGNGPNESYAFSVGSYFEKVIPEFEEVICSNNSNALVLGAAYNSPAWFNTSDENTILSNANSYVPASPIENAVYGVNCIEVLSGCPETFYYSVESPDPLSLDVFPGNISICQHQDVQLNVEVNGSETFYQYQWTETSGDDTWEISNPVVRPDHTTSYHVVVSTPGGCSVSESDVTVTVGDGGIVNFHAEPSTVSICNGEQTDLSVEFETKTWFEDFEPQISWGDWEEILGGDADQVCGAEEGNGLYFNGVYPRHAITVPMDVTNGGTIHFSLKIADGTFPCDDAEVGDNVVLAYSVNNGAWTNITTYNESAYPDFVQISVEIPAAAMSASTRFRWRQTGSYMANQDNWVLDNMYVGVNNSNAYTVNWTPASTLDNAQSMNPVASPASTTIYVVELNDAGFGCTYRDSVEVEVGLPFTLDMTDDLTLCDVQGVALAAEPSIAGQYEYVWSPQTNITGIYSANPQVSPQSSVTYHVDVTSEEGCTASGDVAIVVSALLDLNITADDDSICEGSNTILNASISGNPSDMNFDWSPMIGLTNLNGGSATAAPTSSTEYTCVVTDDNSGCTISESIWIDVTPAFVVTVVPPEVSACVVSGTAVNATSDYVGALNWTWVPAIMVSDPNVAGTTLSGIQTGILTVTATSTTGCSASADIVVTEEDETTNLGEDTGLCEGDVMTLETGWPETYDILWNTGATVSSLQITEPGVYHVEVTSPDGCFSEDEIVITGYSYPVIDLGSDTAFCEGQTLILHGNNPGSIHQWSNGSTTPDITVTESGVFSVVVDNGFCQSSDEITIAVNPQPVKPFADEKEHCFDFEPELVLDAQNVGSSYLWSDGSQDQKLALKESGDYFVVVTTAQHCESIFDITIEEDCPSYLFVPNAFSPDGDGVNDVWKPEGTRLNKYELRIYDRWGSIIFETNDIDTPWIGQCRGGEYFVEPGVYSYVIIYNTHQDNGLISEDIRMKGSVTVLR